MWKVTGSNHSIDYFVGLRPELVLYSFDGPRIFTCRDDEGLPLLAYECDRDEEGEVVRYVVVPVRNITVDDLKEGRITMRQALLQPRAWIVDVGNGTIIAAWNVDAASIPEDVLPKPGTFLMPRHHLSSQLPPDLRTRVRKAQSQLFRQGGTLWASLGTA